MISFEVKFQVYNSPCVKVPTIKRYNDNFWCSLNIKNELIMCNVIYLGNDENMLQNKWYDGIVELPYGEEFTPYCLGTKSKYNSSLCINMNYNLQVGGEKVGDVILIKVKEIVRGSFNIKHHPDGSI